MGEIQQFKEKIQIRYLTDNARIFVNWHKNHIPILCKYTKSRTLRKNFRKRATFLYKKVLYK